MSAAAISAGPARVVIVDDTLDLRELLRLALTRGGMEVVAEAADGLSGIEAVRAERPDLVLLDLSMPVMDGLEALPGIRQLVPEAKIIVLSAFGATQMSERALAIGADGYLQKGTSLKRILSYLQVILESDEVDSGAPARSPNHPLVPPPTSLADQMAAQAVVAASMPRRSMQPDHSTSRHDISADPDDELIAEALPSELRPDVMSWEALSLAPYGVLQVADEALLRIVHANPTAQRLLANQARCGVPLGAIAPQLSSLVSVNRMDSDPSFVTQVCGEYVLATLRRGESSLLIYLDSKVEDVGQLRRAIATTAQQLRGPVAALCGVAESLGEGTADLTTAQNDMMLSAVARQVHALDAITADLLTAADLQRGMLRLSPESVPPTAVIDTVVEERSTVRVDLRVRDERPVYVDPERLEQMVGNLIGNALKYGRAPFLVEVNPHPAYEHFVDIDVTDCGDGVPEEFIDRLFVEFAWAGGGVAPGGGLGLYVVRSLAEAHGGSVAYSATAAGGARFTLTLPAA